VLRLPSTYFVQQKKKASMSQEHVQEHIDLIAKHEQEFLAKRTSAERLGDAIAGYAGSLGFVILHLLVFAGWVMVNTLSISDIRHFDPPPYSLLGTLFAFEAILLGSFILMRQTRMSRRSDERDHLILQVLLLTEKEITAVLGVDRQIAERMGLQKVTRDKGIEQLSQDTSIESMAQTIKESLPSG
jgi:uncharacterized membrane protein